MAELAMLADIQRTVYPEEVTRQLHAIEQARESSQFIDRRSNHCATPPTGKEAGQESDKDEQMNEGMD